MRLHATCVHDAYSVLPSAQGRNNGRNTLDGCRFGEQEFPLTTHDPHVFWCVKDVEHQCCLRSIARLRSATATKKQPREQFRVETRGEAELVR